MLPAPLSPPLPRASDLERGHHGLPRTEAREAESGLLWDPLRKEWVTDEEADGEAGFDEGESQDTALGRGKVAGEKEDGVVWMEWEVDDPDNPFWWSSTRKWTTTWITCFFTLAVAIAGSAFAIGTASLIEDLGCSRELAVLGLSAFPLGFGLAPLLLAPFSEAYGRYTMYATSSAVYVIFLIPTALGQNIATVIVGRFIGGCAASTGSTLVGGTIADLFEASNRGLPMAIFSVCAFAGTGLGPGVMGYVAQNLGWRWIQYLQMILGGILFIALVGFTRETRGSVILSRRAARMRKETGDQRYQCRTDAERASLLVLIKVSMSRPIYLLFTEAIVFFFSLWIAFAWGFMYLTLQAIPLIMTNVYGFEEGATGLTFFSVVVAAFLGLGANVFQEKLYTKNFPTRGPEARLYASCIGGLLFPAGIFIVAFSQGRGSFIGPVIGMTILFTGIYTIYLATFNYLADCYTLYASSALSGQSLCRNLAGAAFPLFTDAMYVRLGYQWASFLAGCLALLLAATPWVLLRYGPRIRASSKFAKELERLHGGS